MRKKLWLGIIALAILGSQFGIAVIVTEWRSNNEPVADIIQLQPSPTLRVDPAECQAAVALFEAIDTVLERASNPTENLREEWGRAAGNMDNRCLIPTPTPPSN